jgi:hypothetical protein
MTNLLAIAKGGLRALLNWKIHSVRWVDIICSVLIAVLLLSVYVGKAAADRENRRIVELESQIAESRQRVRLLRAEIARLEQPGRLETLSRSVGLEPVDVHRQATEAELSDLKVAEGLSAQPARSAAQPTLIPSEALQ